MQLQVCSCNQHSYVSILWATVFQWHPPRTAELCSEHAWAGALLQTPVETAGYTAALGDSVINPHVLLDTRIIQGKNYEPSTQSLRCEVLCKIKKNTVPPDASVVTRRNVWAVSIARIHYRESGELSSFFLIVYQLFYMYKSHAGTTVHYFLHHKKVKKGAGGGGRALWLTANGELLWGGS